MSATAPLRPPAVRRVREVPGAVALPYFRNHAWSEDWPWLEQGITGRGTSGDPFDLGLFGAVPAGTATGRWRALRETLGFTMAVHARQVHGARVLAHGPAEAGLLVAVDADGHATRTAGVLLTVSVADCVPVQIVAPAQRAVALLHAGWRGVAAGIVETGLTLLRRRWQVPAAAVHMHLGPAICGACYEVGAEVLAALDVPAGGAERACLDLRAVIARRAMAQGVAAALITTSDFCTRCSAGDNFFSHRGGSAGRQVAVLGIRRADG